MSEHHMDDKTKPDENCESINMATPELNVDKIVEIFREIVKRKTAYNETNLHYEYFKRVGDTIPFKSHGYSSLRDLIQKTAGDQFYFERVSKDLEFIAPKRIDHDYSTVNKALKKVTTTVSTNGKDECYSICSDATKRIRVSNNIIFGQPKSTGINNPFQNIRNDIKISFDFGAQKREVDCQSTTIDASTMEQTESVANDKQQLAEDDVTCGGTYSTARTKVEPMIIEEDTDNFPWDDKYWHLKISHVNSTNEVWARFFDKFDEQMRKMTSKLIQTITANPKRCRIRSNDDLYVVKDKQNYYRATVLKIEPEIVQCKCFLVDIGCVKWFDEDEIFICPREFRDIPALAMRFCLYGLVEFKNSRSASEITVNELSNKELWAKIKIKPKDFYKQTGKHKPIPVILYDTMNRNARTNISADIMEKIVATFKPPKLSKTRTNYVSITHISKVTGNIYCHLINSMNDLKYVIGMIDAVVENGVRQSYEHFESETDLHELLAINANKLYLIYSEHDQMWYRATILQLETDVSESTEKNICRQCNVYCFLVDYGNTRVVNLTNVYDLPGILARYPHLAVAITLDGVHMSRTKIDQLKMLLLPGDNVFVDVIETMNCGDSNKTKTVSVAKISKLEKNMVNNETYVSDINWKLKNGH
ncbi:uncharacterized protein LOC116349304 [Contarinia nasturtii]|uniref:uncharacterized protein LOC116349304 n=1 Tax=Contarinia nasturtii TaxID=265458 RepID=UPI0012D440DE|nr:uncharacterized protein LOC116349304 [Contarinia nasturtii]